MKNVRRVRITLLLTVATLLGGFFVAPAANAETCVRLGELGLEVCLPIL